jgi:hypothetical protein
LRRDLQAILSQKLGGVGNHAPNLGMIVDFVKNWIGAGFVKRSVWLAIVCRAGPRFHAWSIWKEDSFFVAH